MRTLIPAVLFLVAGGLKLVSAQEGARPGTFILASPAQVLDAARAAALADDSQAQGGPAKPSKLAELLAEIGRQKARIKENSEALDQDAAARKVIGVQIEKGGWIAAVLKGGPAQHNGIKAGEVITTVGAQDTRLLSAEQVRALIESAGDEVRVRVESLGKPPRDLTLKKASLSLLTPEFAAARKAELQDIDKKLDALADAVKAEKDMDRNWFKHDSSLWALKEKIYAVTKATLEKIEESWENP